MTHRVPTHQTLGLCLQRLHLLAMRDPSIWHNLDRIIAALTELMCRVVDAERDNALRPGNPDGIVTTSSEPDDAIAVRALYPLDETLDARRDHRRIAYALGFWAKAIEGELGWGPPLKGPRDVWGHTISQSINYNSGGERRTG